MYGTTDSDFFEQIGLALDVYSNYDKFLLAGDFNVQEDEGCIQDFMEEFSARNLVKEKTCFKSLDNPSCIDLFLTNSSQSFQKTTTISTGLSDFHKMIVTVLKTTFPKVKPKVVLYRDYSKFVENHFRRDLKEKLRGMRDKDYSSFENIFLSVLNKHAPYKKKLVRANQKPYLTKQLRKAIMNRSSLEHKFYKCQTIENHQAYKKQNNYCNRLYKRERRKYYSNLDLKTITDNKKFWNTTKPLFSNKGGEGDNIVLVNGNKIISDDREIANTFNDFFKNTVGSLGITENRFLTSDFDNELCAVEQAIEKFKCHPSIISIKENIQIHQEFSFSEVNANEMKSEINNLNSRKAGTFNGYTSKTIKASG